jgi:hydroxymethylbilane synthase
MDTEHLLGSTIDDEPTRAAVTAERAMLAALEAGCSAPVGALADVVEDLVTDADGSDRVVLRLSLRGMAATPDNEILRASAISDLTNADQLGRLVAAELLDLGASVLSGPEA